MAIVNYYFIAIFLFTTYPIISSASPPISKSPNVIIILADDLGYGDLGFQPFNSPEMQYLQTPSLKKMAEDGLSMSNFHVAAPVCSPSRASILVGLFPWRMGVDFIYSGDLKNDGSIELDNEQLPLLPNIAMSFRAAGYYTAHMGKWHLGGQSQYDIPNRNNGNCSAPGINQYGFDEYVGMDEGTGSSRYWTHQRAETYHKGSNYLFKNDIPLPHPTKPEILTDRQTNEAMRVIQEQVVARRPFFLNLWYDAPHSPWELIEPFQSQYQGKYEGRTLKYVTMIANMDYNIGRLLSLLDTLRIAENTIVMFTSDNGPENGAGNAGPQFIGRKRLLTEGGIRVPAIWQWKGHIRPGTTTDKFGIGTDLFPTLLDLAGISCPPSVRLDGVSLSPLLLHPTSTTIQGDERLLLWYSHSVGYPKFTAAWSHGFKLLWADYEDRPRTQLPPAWRLFDMRTSSKNYESTNILSSIDFQNACHTLSTKRRRLLHPSRELGVSGEGGVTWHQIASINRTSPTTKDMLALVQLVIYMHLKMHLFRYEGDIDWRQSYYLNKPYHSYEHSCWTRNASAAVFPWSLPPLVPAFCGSAIFTELRGSSCHCSLNKCSETWSSVSSSEGWTKGFLFRNSSSSRSRHRNLRMSISSVTSTVELERQLDIIMSSSAFSPLCSLPQLPTVAAAVAATGNDHNNIIISLAKSVGMSVKSSLAQRKSQRWSDLLLTHTDDMRYDTLPSSTGTNLQTNAVVNEKWKKFRVTGRTCFPDVPVTILSIAAFASIPLCLSSWNMLHGKKSAGGGGTGSGGIVNEGALIFGLHHILHQYHIKYSGDHRKRRIALLDPMHLPPPLSLLPAKTSSANISSNYYTDSIRILASRIFDIGSSTISNSSSRNRGSRNKVDILLMPLPVSSMTASTMTKIGASSKTNRAKRGIGPWCLAILSGLNGEQFPSLTIIYPPTSITTTTTTTTTTAVSTLSSIPATAAVTANKQGVSKKQYTNKNKGTIIKATDYHKIESTTVLAFRSICWLYQSVITAHNEKLKRSAHRTLINCNKIKDLPTGLSIYEYFMTAATNNGYRDSGSFTMKLFDILLNSNMAEYANNIPEVISGILETGDFSEKSVNLSLLNIKSVIKNLILEQDIKHKEYLRSMSSQIKKTS